MPYIFICMRRGPGHAKQLSEKYNSEIYGNIPPNIVRTRLGHGRRYGGAAKGVARPTVHMRIVASAATRFDAHRDVRPDAVRRQMPWKNVEKQGTG